MTGIVVVGYMKVRLINLNSKWWGGRNGV